MRRNMNGHPTTRIRQGRGLRQGGLLSPILFNLALELLLRSILDNPHFHGFQPCWSPESIPALPRLGPLKVLAYADDIFVFLGTLNDLDRLHEHLRMYEAASNAKFNANKIQAIALSGRLHPDWEVALVNTGITNFHDRSLPEPVIYLGYPLHYSSCEYFSIVCSITLRPTVICMLPGNSPYAAAQPFSTRSFCHASGMCYD